MRRLRDDLGLVPVEYPTTRRTEASAPDRAADLVAAFADPEIRAVMATIGGDDQLTVLPHLDADRVLADPKPFFGFSDNTNLLNWLWSLGIVGYHGGSTQIHLGRGGQLHPVSINSLRRALFSNDEIDLHPVDAFREDAISWDDPEVLATEPPMRPGNGWTWHGPERQISGPSWGGNLEILHWNLAANRWIRPVEDYAGCILLIETSEEMPSATEVFRMLRNMGERGLLEQFPAAIIGRARAARLFEPTSEEERVRYRTEQREAVLRAFATYRPDALLTFDVDIGHTDPQWIVPYGGTITMDGASRRIRVQY